MLDRGQLLVALLTFLEVQIENNKLRSGAWW